MGGSSRQVMNGRTRIVGGERWTVGRRNCWSRRNWVVTEWMMRIDWSGKHRLEWSAWRVAWSGW